MVYNIPAKPTLYNGTQFRSRLEAKWAAFFDLTEWKYEYEPSEINGFNPDFILKCDSPAYTTKTIIVEVKPSVMATPDELSKFYSKYKDVPAHLLFLTDTPFTEKSESGEGYMVIGWGRQWFSGEDLGFTTLEMKCENDIGSLIFSYDGMIHGLIERKMFLQSDEFVGKFLLMRWKEAGNKVQFKVKRGGTYE